MDDSEKVVEIYLKSVGFTDVRYEPDGNIPPDFLADGRVAVEVRRLNQNHDDGTGKGSRGLEETAVPLWHAMKRYLEKLGPATTSGRSWYVFYRFSRPEPDWKTLKRELDRVLKPFMAAAAPQPFEVRLNVGGEFWLKVIARAAPSPPFFRLIGNSDEQSGGWLIDEIQKNLAHCIVEKSAKIQKHASKYQEWWLVLPDYVGFGLNDFDQELIRCQVTIQPGAFDKVVLLDPHDAMCAFQVHPRP